MLSSLDKFFTVKRRGIAALCALGFAVIWMMLWKLFPMEWYVMFFSSIIGSNIQLVLMNGVVLLPMFYVFTKLTKTDLSFGKTVLLNIILTAAVEYVFSIFMFSDKFFLCVIALILHGAANVWVFGTAEVTDGKNTKGMRGEVTRVAAIKKQPLISVIWAAAFTFVTDAAGVALLYIIARIYAY